MRNSEQISINDDLAEWPKITFPLSRLLIGNGASRNIWSNFRYDSLFQVAQVNNDHPLSATDLNLFEQLDTANFERVLYYLYVTLLVNPHFNLPLEQVRNCYSNIQHALIGAVNRTHVPWLSVTSDVLNAINLALSKYSYVYSTNYDLLVYWAVMQNPTVFRDFFWEEKFDVSDTEIWRADVCKVLYLHGALHLCRDIRSGDTIKRTATLTGNLLELFGTEIEGRDVVPLFVAEGTHDEKLSSIYSSDYLTYAYLSLSRDTGNLDIFGTSLGESDLHIVQALKNSSTRIIAFSINPDFEADIIQRKLAIHNLLPHKEIIFYDSRSHPLGSYELSMG